mgnify:CR=1 FL=1
MAYSKINLLDKSYEVIKAYAAGGGSAPLETVLRNVYEELKKINEELKEEGE